MSTHTMMSSCGGGGGVGVFKRVMVAHVVFLTFVIPIGFKFGASRLLFRQRNGAHTNLFVHSVDDSAGTALVSFYAQPVSFELTAQTTRVVRIFCFPTFYVCVFFFSSFSSFCDAESALQTRRRHQHHARAPPCTLSPFLSLCTVLRFFSLNHHHRLI